MTISAELESALHKEMTAEWYALRDLKRANAKLPGYILLSQAGFNVFTPMKWVIKEKQGKRQRVHIPAVSDLLFVKSSRQYLDPVINTTPTLQYRYAKGLGHCQPMTVRSADMERFIKAVTTDEATRYYMPQELTAAMIGRNIRVIGGPLDGYTGRLLALRGSRKRRLIVNLPGFLSAAVEVNPEYIQIE